MTASHIGGLLLSPGYVLFQPSMLHEESSLFLQSPLNCMMQVLKLVLHVSHLVLQDPSIMSCKSGHGGPKSFRCSTDWVTLPANAWLIKADCFQQQLRICSISIEKSQRSSDWQLLLEPASNHVKSSCMHQAALKNVDILQTAAEIPRFIGCLMLVSELQQAAAG